LRTAARASALSTAGAMEYFQGDFSEARRLLEESVSIGREVGAVGKRNLAQALELLGNMALLQGNPGNAKELAEESLQVYQEIGEAWGIAMTMCLLGRATGELGDLVTACSLLEESAAQLRVVGDRQRLGLPLNALGLMALEKGDYPAARARFEEALAVARETEDEQYSADALAHLGTVAFCMGEYHESFSFYLQSLALINREQGTRGDSLIEDLTGLAVVASSSGQLEQAARLLGAVEALREASNIRLSPLRGTEYKRTVEGIRAHLDEATCAAAWKEGCAMGLSQAIALGQVTLLQQLPTAPTPPAKPATPSPEGLTAREVDVLRLLATGLTDAQIAEQLVLSLHTIHAHLRSIYSKLGVTSRSAATRYAFEHQLV
jgi:ATP/maltotriose-dependent transcriptional regulator MalT